MKQTHVYKIDLIQINGNGEFQCPRCGNFISPDDTTEKTYTIVEPKVNSQGLEELIIRCNRCTSYIHLTGFSLLKQTETEKAANNKNNSRVYISHI